MMTPTVPELLAELSRIAARDRADALELELIAQRIADATPARPTAHVAAAERTARRARATAATSSAALTLAHDTAARLEAAAIADALEALELADHLAPLADPTTTSYAEPAAGYGTD